jgi:ferredoxin
MIMMEPKTLEEVVEMLQDAADVAIVGCGKCAKANLVGGEDQVMLMKARLEEEGKRITDTAVIGGLCNVPNSGDEIKNIDPTDAILVLACGAGAQSIAELKPGVRVCPGANAKFLGVFQGEGHHLRMCALCGDCIIHLTGGVCPVARCPKAMVSGPCGDSIDGKCGTALTEGSGHECVWVRIAERGGKEETGGEKDIDWRKAGFPVDIILTEDEIRRRKGR